MNYFSSKWAFSICFFVSSFSYAQLSEKKYVDMHAHVAGFGYKSDCYIGEKMKSKWLRYRGLQFLFGISEGEMKNSPEGDYEIFSHISKLLNKSQRVKSAVLLAFDQVYNKNGSINKKETPFYVSNQFVIRGTRKFSNLNFAASVHPFRKDALTGLEKVSRAGAWMVKLIPSIHKFHPDDSRLDTYWRKLAALKLPLLIHLDDEGTFGEQHGSYTGAYKIERALQLGVTVIAAHVASRGHSKVSSFFKEKNHLPSPQLSNYEQLKILAKKYRNLYADVSALPQAPHRRYDLKKIAIEDIWKGRILYGSDYPLNHWTLQSMYSFKDAWDLWRENGVDPKEFWRGRGMEQRWDRDIRLKEAFGVGEDALTATEKFFRRLGKI